MKRLGLLVVLGILLILPLIFAQENQCIPTTSCNIASPGIGVIEEGPSCSYQHVNECLDEKTILEYKCDGTNVIKTTRPCEGVCNLGKCVSLEVWQKASKLSIENVNLIPIFDNLVKPMIGTPYLLEVTYKNDDTKDLKIPVLPGEFYNKFELRPRIEICLSERTEEQIKSGMLCDSWDAFFSPVAKLSHDNSGNLIIEVTDTPELLIKDAFGNERSANVVEGGITLSPGEKVTILYTSNRESIFTKGAIMNNLYFLPNSFLDQKIGEYIVSTQEIPITISAKVSDFGAGQESIEKEGFRTNDKINGPLLVGPSEKRTVKFVNKITGKSNVMIPQGLELSEREIVLPELKENEYLMSRRGCALISNIKGVGYKVCTTELFEGFPMLTINGDRHIFASFKSFIDRILSRQEVIDEIPVENVIDTNELTFILYNPIKSDVIATGKIELKK